jgi:hypothetical protein
MFFWTRARDEIVIPSTPADFPGNCRITSRPGNLSVRGCAAANSAALQPGGRREIALETLALARGVNPHWQIGGHQLDATWAETYIQKWLSRRDRSRMHPGPVARPEVDPATAFEQGAMLLSWRPSDCFGIAEHLMGLPQTLLA